LDIKTLTCNKTKVMKPRKMMMMRKADGEKAKLNGVFRSKE
jgi:hypothetical protein